MNQLTRGWLVLLGAVIWLTQAPAQSIDPKTVFIHRDAYGVPHIEGPTDAAVAYGLAWAHAEDDFPSIQQNILLARGRLGEFKGVEGTKMDFFVQWLGAAELVEERWNHDLSPAYKQLLQGYASGLTAYGRAFPNQLLVKRDFLPVTPQDIETAFVVTFCAMSGAATALKATLEHKPFRNLVSYGSNGFALNSAKTTDSSTFLLNDPHWLIDGPMTFYEAQLFSQEGWTVNGGFYPGMPMPANAVTPDLGWNLPFNYPDAVDIYRLTEHPDDRYAYWFDGQWQRLERKQAELRVKTPVGLPLTVKRELLRSVHGPVIRTDSGLFAFRIAGLFRLGAGEQLYRMGKAKNFHQFYQALRLQRMPVFNIVYADRQDTIFYHCGGLYPVRKPGWDYLNIVPGDTSLTLWKRFYPLDSIPSVLQPRSGYIYNTNSSPYLCSGPSDDPNPRKYPTTTGLHLNVDNDRSIRFRELVQEHARLDFNTFKGLKYDLEYPKHSAGAARKTQQRFARIDPKNVPPELAEALRIVSTCPLNGKLDNTQAPLFAITVYHLMEKLQFDRVRFMLYGLDTPDDTELLEGLRWAQAYLLRHHKTLTPPLAQVQRIVRGNKELPTPGLSQNLNSCDVDLTPNGILRVNRNSSFIQFAHYRNGKLQRLETAVPYGASNNPKSEHYADQMELHASFQTKPMTLDLAKVRQSARLTYRPKSTEGLHRYTQPSATTDDNE